MTLSPSTSSPSSGPVPSATKALRRLFLTLFLRGRSSRGLKKQTTPRSIGSKLAMTLLFYGLFGLLSLSFLHQAVFALAIYLHAMTFLFLGMFVSSSAGEILFNKDEADILLHRPITPRDLLWAKIRVLVEISLWLAAAFNFAGLFTGMFASDGDWRFPLVHSVSTILEALFCTACVVMVYQLCIRWFGRERLEGVMTTAQVLVSIAAVLSGQILPQIAFRFSGFTAVAEKSWWIVLLPPAWFAGFDDAFAGSMSSASCLLALTAFLATAAVLWLAFAKLAHEFHAGMQRLNETTSPPSRSRQGRRWIDVLTSVPPLSWWLRDPVIRASFLLTTAYLVRDRETKLRVYPAIAPMLVLPFIFMMRGSFATGTSGFGPAFAGAYLGIIPMLAISILQYSQQWQAADIFHLAPIDGPARIGHGTRRAVLCFITFPVIALMCLLIWILHRDMANLLMLLPGIIAVPVYSLIPGLSGNSLPFALPSEEAKSAGRGLVMIGVMVVSMALAGVATVARTFGIFPWFLLAEFFLAIGIYFPLRLRLSRQRWSSIE